MIFRNRQEAGCLLGAELERRGFTHPIVLGITRGGVPIAAEVARILGGELGVIVAQRLEGPEESELGIGAVTRDGCMSVDWEAARAGGVDEEYVSEACARGAEEARRREQRFDGRRPALEGRTVLVVDDGVATGATAVAAIRSARVRGAKHVVFATPLGAPTSLERIRGDADDVVCLSEEPDVFAVLAIEQFYESFPEVDDDEVADILEAWRTVHANRAASPRREPEVLTVGDVMTRAVEATTLDAPIRDVARQMRDAGVGLLLVCVDARPVGVVTDRDLAIRATAEGRDPNATRARDVMTSNIYWCHDDEPVAQALDAMAAKSVRRLVVFDRDDELAGIVSLDDLATLPVQRLSPAEEAPASEAGTTPASPRTAPAVLQRPS